MGEQKRDGGKGGMQHGLQTILRGGVSHSKVSSIMSVHLTRNPLIESTVSFSETERLSTSKLQIP